MDKESSSTLLTPGQQIKPPGNKQIVTDILKRLYAMKTRKISELNSYDDRSYRVLCEEQHANPHVASINKDGYILKIVNSLDSRKPDVIEAQNEMLLFLNEHDIVCPLPIKNIDGLYFSLEKLTKEDSSTDSYIIRLLIFRPGELLSKTKLSSQVCRNVGSFTSKIDKILMGFSNPVYDNHKILWMLASVPKLRQFTYAVKNVVERELALEIIIAFEKEVLPVMPQLEQGIIHGDLNDQNLVMNPEGTDISAVIDFGDTHKTCLLFELSITLCYMILHSENLSVGKDVIEGYESLRKLTELEKRILKNTVCARICQSIIIGAYSHLQDPQNQYLLTTQTAGWNLLKKLWPLSQEEISIEWGLE